MTPVHLTPAPKEMTLNYSLTVIFTVHFRGSKNTHASLIGGSHVASQYFLLYLPEHIIKRRLYYGGKYMLIYLKALAFR